MPNDVPWNAGEAAPSINQSAMAPSPVDFGKMKVLAQPVRCARPAVTTLEAIFHRQARGKAIFEVLFVAGVIAGLSQFWFPAGICFGRGTETVDIARSLAHSGAFADPFGIAATGLTANQPPLFPLLLGALMKLVGDAPLFAFVATLVCIAVQALHAALLPRLSLLLFGELRTGIYAGGLSVLALRLMPSWDAIYTATGLILFCLLAARLLDKAASVRRAGAITGLFAGALTLLNPASLLVSAPCSLFFVRRRKLALCSLLTFYPAFAIGVAAICLPWVVRNYVQLGVFGLRDNFGLTLFASNNPCAESSLALELASGCNQANNPTSSIGEARELQAVGEKEYDRRKTSAVIHWVLQNPQRFRELTVARVAQFWFPARYSINPVYYSYSAWIITLLSIPGLIIAVGRRMPAALLVLGVWLVYPTMYYLVVSDMRYRYPIFWLSLLCAGYSLSALQSFVWKPAFHER
jgi:hypothetical protein